MVINCTCLHVLCKCVSEAMVTGAHLQVLNQVMLLASQIMVHKAKIQKGTPNCIKIPLFLTFEWTHSWSTPHKTIPNKEPRVYDCTWNLKHKWEQYWWQAPPPCSHQEASHFVRFTVYAGTYNCNFLRLGISQQAPTNHWHTQSWSSFPRPLKQCRIYWQNLQRSTESWAIDKLLLLGEVQI